MEETTVLFRPVGENELRLIAESGFRSFPPRLPGQPIFYPVLNEEYATQIARDWNAKNSQSKLAQLDHLRMFFGFFAKLFIVKLCVSITAV